MSQQQKVAISMVVVGIVLGVVGVILDLNGAGAWIHALTWTGGGSFGYGLVLWIRANNAKKPFTPGR